MSRHEFWSMAQRNSSPGSLTERSNGGLFSALSDLRLYEQARTKESRHDTNCAGHALLADFGDRQDSVYVM